MRWMARILRENRAAKEFRELVKASANFRTDLPLQWKDRCLYLSDRLVHTPFDAHYVYHTAWAIRKIRLSAPPMHVDVSSSLYFVALASALTQIEHLDYRPPELHLQNVTCRFGDLMALPFASDAVSSLSCMHVIEHIGLGRYGDPLDPCGDIKAANELQRILAPGGQLLFVAPVGKPRVCFNAHRIYSFEMVLSLFPMLQLDDWALLEDDVAKGLAPNAEPSLFNKQSFGCGCFSFKKRNACQTPD
jgi:SAM-dependent methyltransferase